MIEMARSEERYFQILDTAPDAMVSFVSGDSVLDSGSSASLPATRVDPLNLVDMRLFERAKSIDPPAAGEGAPRKTASPARGWRGRLWETK